MSAGWTPILEGSEAERALQAVDDIARSLNDPDPAGPASLASGHAGLALLHAYLDRAGPGGGHEAVAERCLAHTIDALAETEMPPALYAGFSGIAWAHAHLRTDEAGDDVYEAIDEALAEHVAQQPWTDNHDLVSGLVGFGVYALERLPAAPARTILASVIDRLEETAAARASGLGWLTPPDRLPDWQRQVSPEGHDDLGVAHGLAGAIALLAGAWAAGVERPRAERLLAGAVDWLLAQRNRAEGGSVIPGWVNPDGRPTRARSAWCYGDPGVAATLAVAARVTGQPAWSREAVALARAVAARPAAETRVRDAGLCHGAAGLAHCLNRIAQATGDEVLRDAARRWFAHALDHRRPGRGVGGFEAYDVDEAGVDRWVADPALLTGAAGVALALLAAAGNVEPAWDRMLLLSLRVAGDARA